MPVMEKLRRSHPSSCCEAMLDSLEGRKHVPERQPSISDVTSPEITKVKLAGLIWQRMQSGPLKPGSPPRKFQLQFKDPKSLQNAFTAIHERKNERKAFTRTLTIPPNCCPCQPLC
ncbi:hypothetical protein NC652_033033 [Populus alba x Populus x berolinensis]|nr:hypothetical protein NC652_033033 [Populus alba x Populus x berolinensis]